MSGVCHVFLMHSYASLPLCVPFLRYSPIYVREVGIPSYNDVREACGFSRIKTFEDITSDDTVQRLLADTYGDVELLDAYTGALAESKDDTGLFVGPLLRVS